MTPIIRPRTQCPLVASVLLSTLALLPLERIVPALCAAAEDLSTVLALPAGNLPEGIAVHPTGTVYVGNRVVSSTVTLNTILRIDPDGSTALFATLPSTTGAEGLLGLAVDPRGAVYAALVSFDANHGVWRISRDGRRLELLAGSSEIVFPNALAFDSRGNLYVTDSFGGAIWRSDGGAPFTRWLADPLLLPLDTDPFGVPLPGINGIAFAPPDGLYVANTEQGLITRIWIERDGRPGTIEAVTGAFAVPTVDGIAMDVRGHIYAAIPGSALVGTSPILKVDPVDGTVSAVVTDPGEANRFDTPLSLAFGGGRWGATTLLVTNGDLPLVPGGPGPGVVQLNVGVPGMPVW